MRGPRGQNRLIDVEPVMLRAERLPLDRDVTTVIIRALLVPRIALVKRVVLAAVGEPVYGLFGTPVVEARCHTSRAPVRIKATLPLPAAAETVVRAPAKPQATAGATSSEHVTRPTAAQSGGPGCSEARHSCAGRATRAPPPHTMPMTAKSTGTATGSLCLHVAPGMVRAALGRLSCPPQTYIKTQFEHCMSESVAWCVLSRL